MQFLSIGIHRSSNLRKPPPPCPPALHKPSSLQGLQRLKFVLLNSDSLSPPTPFTNMTPAIWNISTMASGLIKGAWSKHLRCLVSQHRNPPQEVGLGGAHTTSPNWSVGADGQW